MTRLATRRIKPRLRSLLALLALPGCAGMMDQWASTNCNYDAAYTEGMKTFESGQELDLDRYSACPSTSKPDALKGFREGYAQAHRSEAEAHPPETPAAARGGGISIDIDRRGVGIHTGDGAPPPAAAQKDDRKYHCTVEAFGREYSEFGPTRLEASQRAESRCTAENNKIHCDDVVCRENR